MTVPAPIIVSALLDPDSFAWLDGPRRAHFPAERNHPDAHLTLFNALPPSVEPELKRRLSSLTRGRPLAAEAGGLVGLGRGVAVRIVSPQLGALREGLSEAFHGMLTPQDSAGWRPHVTVQNKISTAEARDLLAELSATFRPRRVEVVGFAAWRVSCRLRGCPLSNMALESSFAARNPDTRHRASARLFGTGRGTRRIFHAKLAEHAPAHGIGDKAEQAYRRSDALERR